MKLTDPEEKEQIIELVQDIEASKIKFENLMPADEYGEDEDCELIYNTLMECSRLLTEALPAKDRKRIFES